MDKDERALNAEQIQKHNLHLLSLWYEQAVNEKLVKRTLRKYQQTMRHFLTELYKRAEECDLDDVLYTMDSLVEKRAWGSTTSTITLQTVVRRLYQYLHGAGYELSKDVYDMFVTQERESVNKANRYMRVRRCDPSDEDELFEYKGETYSRIALKALCLMADDTTLYDRCAMTTSELDRTRRRKEAQEDAKKRLGFWCTKPKTKVKAKPRGKAD